MNDLKKPGLLQVMRQNMRLAHMSYTTEKNYIAWVKSFMKFFPGRHPREMGAEEITQFLSFLAEKRQVSSATQNQALCALVSLYRNVLKREPGELQNLVWAKRLKFIPGVLSIEETKAVLNQLTGVHRFSTINLRRGFDLSNESPGESWRLLTLRKHFRICEIPRGIGWRF